MKISNQRFGALNESDRLTIAQLLIKAGYTVRLTKEKDGAKASYNHYIEFFEDKETEK